MTNELTRRDALRAGVGTLAAGVAGCLGAVSGGSESDGTAVQSSFFVLGDFADRVAGDAADANTLVPVGQHGHGWEPSGQLQRDVLTADAFVYVGEGFQPWADDIVANVQSDDADVEPIAAWENVDLLPVDGDHEGDTDHEDGHEEDHNESEGGHEDAHDESEDDHDHGDADPHFWLDPTRAATAVETIAEGMAAVDPDNEETYAENAEAYREELAALDERFESTLSSTSRDAVLVAGHDSFGYLARRYGFEVHALTGLSPDDSPSQRDVREAQEVVDAHGIEHVLAPVFESDRAAEQLVEETDATEVLPVTALPGQREDWAADGWGYVEVQENLNLPSLATALGAE
ncbi:zinc ABC transporter solute-binding protein [Halostella sp. JP-L12]|uniref:metal ABC transporter substrate-binding protein n=1 Tax=Halostella TaxID=1843185 RepID=UPI000EF7CF3D|nr:MULTISPECIES: metal ABC transporter substrate-binding protein [Halostella]NHN48307.1 zinc ABC transporter solute-binding protein [Halostella sp. JP-L12]